jgi:hypothetical protein
MLPPCTYWEAATAEVRHIEVHLAYLVLPESKQHNVAHVHPDLLTHLAANVTKPLHSIHALRFEAALAEHAQHLGILCTLSCDSLDRDSVCQTLVQQTVLKAHNHLIANSCEVC